jgi:hypothetical protein
MFLFRLYTRTFTTSDAGGCDPMCNQGCSAFRLPLGYHSVFGFSMIESDDVYHDCRTEIPQSELLESLEANHFLSSIWAELSLVTLGLAFHMSQLRIIRGNTIAQLSGHIPLPPLELE